MAFDLNKGKPLPAAGSPAPAAPHPGNRTLKKGRFIYWLLPVAAVICVTVIFMLNRSRGPAGSENKTIPGTFLQAKKDSPSANRDSGDKGSAAGAASHAEALDHQVPAVFEAGKSALHDIDKSLADKLVGYLLQNPGKTVMIYGYTSSEGPVALNLKLSEQRAVVFKNYLVSRGIPADRILALGRGSENPLAPNTTAGGRIKNRRVEISF